MPRHDVNLVALSRVRGYHLLDTLDDGTEMAEPDPFLMVSSSLVEDINSQWDTNE